MISVVVPAYNEENLIRECLKSLADQDFTGSYEVIVVDNGSGDNTAQIARDMGVRVISCSEKGVSHARQAGADSARGEIVVQADADTIYPRWWLSRIQKQFTSHTEAIAIAGTFIYRNPPWWGVIEYFLRAFFNLLTALLFGRPFIISGANFAFIKKALTQIKGYDQNAYSSDQFDISTRLSKLGKIIYDLKSYGATSERSVAKPAVLIIFAFVRNLSCFALNLTKVSGGLLKKRGKKLNSLPTGTYIKIAVPVFLVGVLCYGYYVPASPVFGKVYYRSITQAKVIALTFDDGPNEPYTSQVLDILEKNNVPATFFLIGYNVELYPAVAKRILKDGDVIGNHSYSHNANHALIFDYYKNIQLAQQAIHGATGIKPHLYRGPHGKKSPWELEAIKSEGLIDVMWNVSTNELSGRSPEFLANQIIQKARCGGIILLHDGYGTLHDASRADKHETVEMLPIIIQHLQAEGYSFVTVPELLNVPAYN